MKAKEYLGQVRTLDILITNKKETLARLRARVTSITAPMGDKINVQTSPRHDRLEESIVKIVDLENRITEDIKRLAELKDEIMRTIDTIGDADLINLLYKRYIHLKPWFKIAGEMNYSEQHIFRLHGKALIKIQNIINKRSDT